MISEPRKTRSEPESSPTDRPGTGSSKRARRNERAIELSEKTHIELVLYASGVEFERDRLLEVLRDAREKLAAIMKTGALSPDVREGCEQVLEMLTAGL